MKINLKTQLNLPEPIQTGPHLALPIDGARGVCPSFYSPDKLDKEAIKYIEDLQKKLGSTDTLLRAADLGCSPYFPQAIRFAKLGVYVDAFDINPPINELNSISKELGNKINYIQANLIKPIDLCLTNKCYQVVYSNRFISHIPYTIAKELIKLFIDHADNNCRFFISFGSLKSKEAEEYSDYKKPVEERFSIQKSFQAKQHQLTEPVCLYSKSDIYDKFLVGFNVEIIDEIEGTESIKVVFDKITETVKVS